jgi:O-antigen/teichoic acid export membrane protein
MQRNAAPGNAAAERRAGLVDSAFYLVATVVGRAAQLLALPLLVRMLPAAEFGAFDLALVTVTLVATALLMGTDSGVAPEYARCDPADLPAIQSIFASSCRVPLVLWASACAFMALVQASGLAPREFFPGAWLIAVCALLFSLLGCLVGLLRWTMRARSAAGLTAIMGVVPLGGALLAGWLLEAPSSLDMLAGLAVGYALAAGLAVAVSLPVLRGLASTRPAFAVIELLKRSWTMGAASLAGPLRRSAERLIILALLGEVALAAYAVLARVSQVLEIVLQALGNGLYPRALRLLADDAGKQLAVQSLRLFWIASMAGVLVCALGAPFLLELMGGSAFAGSPYLLPVAAAAACLAALPFSAGMAYFHSKRIALYAGMLMLTSLASLLFAWAGAWVTQSLAGWCAGLLAGSALIGVAFIHVSERLHPVGYRTRTVALAFAVLALEGMLPLLVLG